MLRTPSRGTRPTVQLATADDGVIVVLLSNFRFVVIVFSLVVGEKEKERERDMFIPGTRYMYRSLLHATSCVSCPHVTVSLSSYYDTVQAEGPTIAVHKLSRMNQAPKMKKKKKQQQSVTTMNVFYLNS